MTRSVLRAALAAALLATSLGVAIASEESAGTASGNFLSIGGGASAWSMAGASLAGGHDLAATSWNPASLAFVDATQFSLSHAPLPGGATQDWLAAGGRVGMGATRWAVHALFHQEGALEGRDAANNPTGALSVSDLAVGARLAHPLGGFASVGAGAQWVHESLAGSNGSGIAFDAGVRATAGPVGLAIAARQLGAGMSYGGARYDLPTVVAAGVSWSDVARGLRFETDLESPLHYARGVRLGGEWNWRERVAVRGGYRLDLGGDAAGATSAATFGLGAGVSGVWMDYAFSPGAADGLLQHRVGLTFRPGLPGRHGSEERTRSVAPSFAPAAPPAAAVVRAARPVRSGESVAPPAAPPTAPPASRPTTIEVAPGETLALLARRWQTSVAALMEVNSLVAERVSPGQRLRLPAATPAR